MKTWWLMTILVAALALAAGCETTAKAQARENLEHSQAAYEKCLEQHLDDPSKCEILKRAYEADLAAFRQADSSTAPVTTGFIEFGPGGSRK